MKNFGVCYLWVAMGPHAYLRDLVAAELTADGAAADVTTALLGAEGARKVRAVVRAREAGVFCGEAVIQAFQEVLGESARVRCLAREGASLGVGAELVEMVATADLCLRTERTLLNILSHACGIASLTHRFVEAVKPHGTRILATRKTLPGLRPLELMAVEAGGGFVHRRSLSDGILIKDNHQAFLAENTLVERARRSRSPLHGIEVEVQSPAVLDRVLQSPPDVIMLDNMGLRDLETAVRRIGRRARVEVSGGVRLEMVNAIAALGVDYISVGALTHSARALDLTMDMIEA